MRKEIRFYTAGKIIAVFGLAATLVISQPFGTTKGLAAEIEDCDLDGYDDHTGNPVPWIGFDSTKGDSIPGDWDHSTIYKSIGAYQEAHSKKEEKTESSNNDSEKKSKDSKKSSSKESKKSTEKKSAKKDSAKKDAAKKESKAKEEKKEVTATTKPEETNNLVEPENTESPETLNEETAKDTKKKNKKTKAVKGAEEAPITLNEEGTEVSNVEAEKITVGVFNVDEADGNIIHAGSKLIITGAGFDGNIEDIGVEIHSDKAILLGNVTTAADGSFQTKVAIPKDLTAGNHKIILTYQGKEIASQSIKVGAKAADTFLGALTVGFTTENKGLIPGLLLLAGLLGAGIITLLFSGVLRKKKID